MDASKYLIIGGGLAGGKAVEGIRKVDAEGAVTLVTAEPHRPYQRPPLSKDYLRGQVELDHVYLREPGFYPENGVELITGARAAALDPATRRVRLEDGRELGYEKLLLATGGRAWRLPLPGNELEGVYTLRTIDDSQRIRAAAADGASVLILGGSFIGAEVAASLAQSGAQVTMAFPEGRLLERVGPEPLSELLHRLYAERGVRILPRTTATELQGAGRVEWAVLDRGESLAAQVVVMGVGIRLNTELAQSAGLEMDAQGAVVVDDTLRTSDPHIYAAGDIASWPDPTFGKRLRVEHWDVARLQGTRAGRNMAGEDRPYTALPYFFSDLFDLSVEAWGDLAPWEQTVLRGSLEAGSFAYFYFREGRMVGALTANRPDGERKPVQELIRARAAYDAVAARLPDESEDLAAL